MKSICYIIIILFGTNLTISSQVNNNPTNIYYTQAIEYIKGNSFLGKPLESYSRIQVSSQLVPFDVLGWFYQTELSKKLIGGYIPQGKFDENDYKINDSISEFSNCKRRSKFLVFFTEYKDGFILAEVLRKSNTSDYPTASMFGQGTVFLFEYSNKNLKSVLQKKVNHN